MTLDEKNALIAEMLKTCLREIEDEGAARFIESLDKWWTEKGFLTVGQFNALKKFHDNI